MLFRPPLCLAALVAALALFLPGSAGMASAQPEPTLTITHPSGLCDATLEVTGSGFEPRVPAEAVILYLLEPGTADVSMGGLNPAVVEADGTFTQWAALHEVGCEAAQMDRAAAQPTGRLVIAAAWSTGGPSVPSGEPIPDILAVAEYEYTTTTPYVPTETMVISPPSGPCDATVEVAGHGFPPSTAIRLDIIVPQGDGSMGKLASLTTDPNGRFVTNVTLGSLGCRAAVLDTDGQLWISADLEERVIEPGQGIPPILTRAPYTYTTTEVAPQPLPDALAPTGSGGMQAQPTLTISPPSGPCDASVEISGNDFEPGTTIALHLARPHSEGSMAKLGSATTDAIGGFSLAVSLGVVGCEAAALDTRADDPGEPKELQIYASHEPRRPQVAAWAFYTYTTTSASPALSAFPGTGSGPTSDGGHALLLPLLLGLAAMGLLTVAAFLCVRRQHHRPR